jgi:hypothetical protein
MATVLLCTCTCCFVSASRRKTQDLSAPHSEPRAMARPALPAERQRTLPRVESLCHAHGCIPINTMCGTLTHCPSHQQHASVSASTKPCGHPSRQLATQNLFDSHHASPRITGPSTNTTCAAKPGPAPTNQRSLYNGWPPRPTLRQPSCAITPRHARRPAALRRARSHGRSAAQQRPTSCHASQPADLTLLALCQYDALCALPLPCCARPALPRARNRSPAAREPVPQPLLQLRRSPAQPHGHAHKPPQAAAN